MNDAEKHTPGPWRIGPINYADVYAANGDLVALVIKDNPATVADARLIAAAPDLLEACQNCKGLFDNPIERRRKAGDQTYKEAMAQLRSALARVEGREEAA